VNLFACKDKSTNTLPQEVIDLSSPQMRHNHSISVYELELKPTDTDSMLSFRGKNLVKLEDKNEKVYYIFDDSPLLINLLSINNLANGFITTPFLAKSKLNIGSQTIDILFPVNNNKVTQKNNGTGLYSPDQKGDRGCTFHFYHYQNSGRRFVENWSRSSTDPNVMVLMEGLEHVGNTLQQKSFWYHSNNLDDISTINQHLNAPVQGELFSGFDNLVSSTVIIDGDMELFLDENDTTPVATLTSN